MSEKFLDLGKNLIRFYKFQDVFFLVFQIHNLSTKPWIHIRIIKQTVRAEILESL